MIQVYPQEIILVFLKPFKILSPSQKDSENLRNQNHHFLKFMNEIAIVLLLAEYWIEALGVKRFL